jgi:hypothetical protein
MGRLGTIAIDNQHIQNVAVVDHEVDFHRVGLGFPENLLSNTKFTNNKRDILLPNILLYTIS